MKYIEKSYPEYFETIPFLFIRAIMIISLVISTSYCTNEKILRPNEIIFKLPFFIRTNFNFFYCKSFYYIYMVPSCKYRTNYFFIKSNNSYLFICYTLKRKIL